jgi:hypothetical protein
VISAGVGVNSLAGLGILGADKKVRRQAFTLTGQILQASHHHRIPLIILRDRDTATAADLENAMADARQGDLPITIVALKKREIENYFLTLSLLRDFLTRESHCLWGEFVHRGNKLIFHRNIG